MNLVPFSYGQSGPHGRVPAEALATFTRKRDAVAAAVALPAGHPDRERLARRVIAANRTLRARGWFFYPAA